MSNYYRRNLPHYQPAGGEFFVTFRLANSLPKSVVDSLKKEYEQLAKNKDPDKKQKLGKKYFNKFDNLLDRSDHGQLWLKNDEIAKVVVEKLHHFNHKKYFLICYCIMPNHVHLLFRLPDRDESRPTATTYPVTNIMRLIKGATAHDANQILNRKGAFWQHESYDHLVRNSEERERIIRYILKNPVQAKLVKKWDDWQWTYCKEKYFPIR